MIQIMEGDCCEVLKTLPAESVDAVVTDPPYHLTTGKKGGIGPASVNLSTPAGRSRITTGFMGKSWDGGDVAFRAETWAEVLRVLKPGAHLLAFGGTRTYHRLVCAVEDAGFEIRDQIGWLYLSGFPKSLDVGKAIPGGDWEGWETALKPCFEPIVVARKPLAKGNTVAANVLQHGTGAINIDGCRIPLNGDYKCKPNGRPSQTGLDDRYDPSKANQPDTVGRWPANLIHDGSDEIVALFPESKGQQGDVKGTEPSGVTNGIYGKFNGRVAAQARIESGVSSARFFYAAKASKADRGDGNTHPTVKPTDLMRYLCKLVTPPGGTVLDPFAGSGSTLLAAGQEGFDAIGIELLREHIEIAKRRLYNDAPLFADIS